MENPRCYAYKRKHALSIKAPVGSIDKTSSKTSDERISLPFRDQIVNFSGMPPRVDHGSVWLIMRELQYVNSVALL